MCGLIQSGQILEGMPAPMIAFESMVVLEPKLLEGAGGADTVSGESDASLQSNHFQSLAIRWYTRRSCRCYQLLQ